VTGPTIVQIDTTPIAQLIAQMQRKQERETPSPLRSKILDLSKRILVFALDREREEPPRTVPHGATPQDTQKIMEAEWSAGVRFSNETSAKFMAVFGSDLGVMLHETDVLGINTKQVSWDCQNASIPMLIQRCGVELSALADQVPSGK
jgi:hypothetical protein